MQKVVRTLDLFLIFASLLFFTSISMGYSGYRVPVGTKIYITEHAVQRTIANGCSADIFVPTATSTEWTTFLANAPGCITQTVTDPCAGALNPGDVCADGMIYIGTNATIKYQTTPANCSNSATPNCSFTELDSLYKIWAPAGGVLGASSTTDSAANVSLILGSYPTQDTAAKYCDDLTLGGYTDWFLPAQTINSLMYTNRTKIVGYRNTVNHYWSSTENNSTQANTNLSNKAKIGTDLFRCVRVLP